MIKKKDVVVAIGARLREARAAASLTQFGVARELRITRQAVSAWERGESTPTVGQWYRIGVLYGVSLDYLVYGVKTMPVGDGMLVEIFKPRTEAESL